MSAKCAYCGAKSNLVIDVCHKRSGSRQIYHCQECGNEFYAGQKVKMIPVDVFMEKTLNPGVS